jgi:uncharacterized protein YbjQ (UPF0145 family)
MSSSDPTQVALPQDALRRLGESELKAGGARLFTSDLSVKEFVLVKEAGFEPRGLVMGSSMYHIGIQARRWGQSGELDKLTQAMYTARELAMSRMEAEARLLGADGVVGVRLDVNFYEWGQHSAEFIAIGTAVSAQEPERWPLLPGRPFTSDLSGQDFWTLLRAGFFPVGLVLGNCVYHVAHRNVASAVLKAGQNQELANFTQALYDARELAMSRMQAEAEQLKAEGIVGVRLTERSDAWGSHAIEFLAIGTAVVSVPAGPSLAPQPVLSLDQ